MLFGGARGSRGVNAPVPACGQRTRHREPGQSEPAAGAVDEPLRVERAEHARDATDAPREATREDPELGGEAHSGEVVEGEEKGDPFFGVVHGASLPNY